MSTAALNASLQTLNQAVTNRLTDEDRFKREVYNKINQLIAGLNICASEIASASSTPAREAAVSDLTEQLRALNSEVARLQSNRLTGADSDYVTQPLRAEALANNLKWDTSERKRAFVPPAYTPGYGASVSPPPYPGTSSSRFSGWPFGSSSGSPASGSSAAPSSSSASRSPPSLFDDDDDDDGGVPLRPVTTPPPPAALDPSLRSSDPFASAIGHSGGWSPKRTPRRTPRRTPKKKSYRR